MREHNPPSFTPQDVRDIAEDLDDTKIAAILASTANAEQLEEAMAWASGESDIMGDLERPRAGVVAQLFAILKTGEGFPKDRDQVAGAAQGSGVQTCGGANL
jgi:hypothetical protein